MTRILVAEDSRTQAAHIQYCLERAGYTVELALNGVKAIEAIARQRPNLVVTDLQMPEMDGLQLVEEVGQTYPELPVILLTHEGSEELAIAALERGAAGFMAKNQLQHGIARALFYVLPLADGGTSELDASPSLTHAQFQFELANDLNQVAPLARQWQNELVRFRLLTRPYARQMALAFAEGLDNAVWHGNLELGPTPRDECDPVCQTLVAERRAQAPFRDRRVTVEAEISPSQAICTIRDEGGGFNTDRLDRADDPSNLVESHGRGLTLMRLLVDSLEHNAQGNEITLIKRSRPSFND